MELYEFLKKKICCLYAKRLFLYQWQLYCKDACKKKKWNYSICLKFYKLYKLKIILDIIETKKKKI